MTTDRWVLAAPFRAHLLHVAAGTGTSWPVLALHAGLSVRLVRDLVDVRPGRRVLRIAPELARRVLAISEASVRRLAVTQVSPQSARSNVQRLAQLGWTSGSLARQLHIPADQLDALYGGSTSEISALLELRLAALVATSEHPAAARRPQLAA